MLNRNIRPGHLLLCGLTLTAVLTSACGHKDDAGLFASPGGGGGAGAETASAAGAAGAAGDFGTAKGICGPGSPSGAPARGVSASTIQIGVLNDAGNQLQPGLGQIYVDAAEAFASWCNAAGGINGRQIKIASRDAMLTQAPARIVDACQSDFMLVGGATPFDDGTVAPREKCGLGSIPTYVASATAQRSGLQALVNRGPVTQANVMLAKRLLERFPDAMARIGWSTVDVASFIAPNEVNIAAVRQIGSKVVSFQRIPITASNLRTYIQPLKGATNAFVLPPIDANLTLQAMVDVGYEPEVMLDLASSTYGPPTTEAFKALPQVKAPYYVQLPYTPLELADQVPAVALVRDLLKKQGADPDVPVAVEAMSSWVLFAQSAAACGDDLTVGCVIGTAKRQKAFEAGGLVGPVDISDPLAAPCEMIISGSAAGYRYDKVMTRPTDGLYNCDRSNVVELAP